MGIRLQNKQKRVSQYGITRNPWGAKSRADFTVNRCRPEVHFRWSFCSNQAKEFDVSRAITNCSKRPYVIRYWSQIDTLWGQWNTTSWKFCSKSSFLSGETVLVIDSKIMPGNGHSLAHNAEDLSIVDEGNFGPKFIFRVWFWAKETSCHHSSFRKANRIAKWIYPRVLQTRVVQLWIAEVPKRKCYAPHQDGSYYLWGLVALEYDHTLGWAHLATEQPRFQPTGLLWMKRCWVKFR